MTRFSVSSSGRIKLAFLIAAFSLMALLTLGPYLGSLETAFAAPSGAWPRVVVDDTGARVEITSEPRRIVSLAPSNTEVLFALGLGDRVVGVTTACTYPAEAQKKAKVGDYNISVEKVVGLAPDLVVAVSSLQEAVISQLRGLGIKVVAVNPTTFDETMAAITLIGKATGADAAAARIVNDAKARIDAVQARVARVPAARRVKVFVEIWNEPLMTAGKGTFVDDLVRLAGGVNIAGSVQGWAQFSPETVIAQNPDVVILTNFNKAEALSRAAWQGISAFRKGQVFEANPDLLVRPGPRLIDGVEWLARTFYPELFKSGGESR